MNDYQDDEALARLRGADPATGAHPDLHKISALLRGRTPLGRTQSGSGSYAATASGSADSSTAVRINDPSMRTGRSGLLVAASVAALSLGGGGYALGAATAGGGDGGGGTSVAASTTDSEGSDSSADGSGDASGRDDQAMVGMSTEGDMDADEAHGESASSSGGGNYVGPVIPVPGPGLSTKRTTGPVWVPDTSSSGDTSQMLRDYAAALGIEGDFQEDEGYGGSVTDSTDGRTLSVYDYSGLNIDYSNPALDSYCAEMVAEMSEGGYSWFGPGGPTDLECATLGDPPAEDAAITMAQDFLTEIGIDYSGYEFSADYTSRGIACIGVAEGDEAATTAAPDDGGISDSECGEGYTEIVDDGMADVSVRATGSTSPAGDYRPWHFSVTSEGVSYANVAMVNYVELGDYEVISPAEAVERLSDSRFQHIGAWIPDADYSYPEYTEEWIEPDRVPVPAAGEPLPFPLTESPVTNATLETGVISLWDGTEYLVPVYALSDGQGNYWEVLGLTEESLDFTP